jgi:hypothetical protein
MILAGAVERKNKGSCAYGKLRKINPRLISGFQFMSLAAYLRAPAGAKNKKAAFET